jgi:ATP-binding cassette subfamily B protein/subfamily B ATP-binding cassette protein MsbA
LKGNLFEDRKLKKYARLLRYATIEWRGWARIFLLTLLTGGIGLLQPWPIKFVVDHAIGGEPMPESLARAVRNLPGGADPRGFLAWMVLAIVALFAAASAADAVLTRTWVRIGQHMVYRLAGDLFAHIQRRSLLFHSRNSVGDSLSRITGDSWCVYKAVDSLLFTPGFAVVMTAALIVMMARLDVGLTLLTISVAPLMAAATFAFGKPIRRAARARREIEAQIQSHAQQILSGIPVVQAFAQEQREEDRFRHCAALAVRSQRRLTLQTGIYNLASGLIVALGSGAVLWVGARHALDGRVSIGVLLVFVAYLNALQGQLRSLLGVYGTLQEAGASIDRVNEVFESGSEVRDRPGAVDLPPVRGHVRFECVTFGYEPGQPVLRRVSLEARPGETVAVVGYTGAGKTTLLSLVLRFFDPWEGRVTIDGRDLRDVRLQSLRNQVSLVLQDHLLFPFTVSENIAYGRPSATQNEIEDAARAANIDHAIRHLPNGYDTVIGQRGATLSGGERQRISIARALLRDAPILILDEPTSALDAQTERQLLEALDRLRAGRTTFIIAHRLSTIRNADRIIVLQNGEIIEEGRHSELLARGCAYAQLYHTQTGSRLRPAELVG